MEECMKFDKDAQKPQERLTGRYSNYFKVGFNQYEFSLDFGQLYSGPGPARFHTRIVTIPVYAKSMLTHPCLYHFNKFKQLIQEKRMKRRYYEKNVTKFM